MDGLTRTRTVLAAVATAAGLAALVARAVATAMEQIETAMSVYAVETPSTVPLWMQNEVTE